LSIRDQKKELIKKTQAKMEAKNTLTKEIYNVCLSEKEKENKRILQENLLYEVGNATEIKPIVNLFKMARQLVDTKQDKEPKKG
jgi:hypothetical protein